MKLAPVGIEVTGELGEFGSHKVVFLIEIDGGFPFEKIAPLGSDGIELDVVGHLPASALEEVFEELRQGKDGGAEVEGVAVEFLDVEFASDAFVFLEDLDFVSGGAKRDGGGESAEAGTDDGYFLGFHDGNILVTLTL